VLDGCSEGVVVEGKWQCLRKGREGVLSLRWLRKVVTSKPWPVSSSLSLSKQTGHEHARCILHVCMSRASE
jgi:hypothetical protein